MKIFLWKKRRLRLKSNNEITWMYQEIVWFNQPNFTNHIIFLSQWNNFVGITKHSIVRTLRKKCMQQNFLCFTNKTFCLSNKNLIDIAKCFVGTKKEFCCINTNKIFLLIWQNCFVSVWLQNTMVQHWEKNVCNKTSFVVLTWKFVWITKIWLI